MFKKLSVSKTVQIFFFLQFRSFSKQNSIAWFPDIRPICWSCYMCKQSHYIEVAQEGTVAETLAETIESGPLCTTDLFQNKSVHYF